MYAADSLGSKRVLYATWTSVATYFFWFILVTVAHAQGNLTASPGWLRKGTLWEGISTQKSYLHPPLVFPNSDHSIQPQPHSHSPHL
jgi:hypothetical protein